MDSFRHHILTIGNWLVASEFVSFVSFIIFYSVLIIVLQGIMPDAITPIPTDEQARYWLFSRNDSVRFWHGESCVTTIYHKKFLF